MGLQEDVVSRTRTNLVRVVVAAMLALSACLVAWWPQSAAGSDDGSFLPARVLASQKTPTVTSQPTATVAPTTPAPPPPAPPPASPTKKPTKHPTHSGGGSGSGGNNNGGNHGGGGNGGQGGGSPASHNNHNGGSHSGGGSSENQHAAPPPSSTPTTVHTQAPTVSDTPSPSTEPVRPTEAVSTEAVASVPETPSEEPTAVSTDDVDATQYDGYLAGSGPVASRSAPVWVVPGILLVLTSMLALLGGVLGRGNRAVPATAAVPADEA